MDAKSFVIGFLLALCLMFALGSAEVRFQSSPGRFQVAGSGEIWAILDTQSGVAQVADKGKVTEIRFKEPRER
jgi:hypothetical protein